MRAMASIEALVIGGLLWAGTPVTAQNLPREVLERFCELDAQGSQLTPGGRTAVATLFTFPPGRHDKLIIIRDFVVSEPALKGKKAEFYVEYINLGQLDTSGMHFSRLPTLKVRAGFNLTLTEKNAENDPSAPPTQRTKAASWRIEGAPPEPHLNVQAAVRYVGELRSKAKSEATRNSPGNG